MHQHRLSISVPLEGLPLSEHAAVLREMEALGYADVWSLEVDGTDAFTPLALAAQTTALRLGTAIANVFTRGPATLAQTAAGLAELAPGRFVLGIGSGSQPIVEGWNGGTFASPATRVREYVEFLRPALAGERVTMAGKTVSLSGFRLSRPVAAPIPIYVAALRPGMLRVAGEVADGAIINWLSAEDARKSITVVRDAAERAGRDPEAVEIVARCFMCVDPPSDAADLGMRRTINAYLNVPVYEAFHRWLGRSEALAPMWDAWAAGDRRGAVAAIPTGVVNDLVLNGDVSTRRAAIQAYFDAGVDAVTLYLLSFEPGEAMRRHRLLQGIRDMAPMPG